MFVPESFLNISNYYEHRIGVVEQIENANTENEVSQIWNKVNESKTEENSCKIDFLVAFASNPNTSANLLVYLLNNHPQLERIIAKNPNTPTQHLIKLSKHFTEQVFENPTILSCVENKNPIILNKILANIVFDESGKILKHKDFIINILKSDENQLKSYVSQTLALNKTTPNEILDILSIDKEFNVRLSVTNNPNTSTQTLKKLTNDKSEYILNRAKLQIFKRNKIS
jgi:hypothetical protein